MTPQADALAVTLELRGDEAVVTVTNHGAETAFVWSRANSWGWPTITLVLTPAGGPDDVVVLRPADRIFTRNGPGVVEIAGGDAHRLELRPRAEGWIADGAIGGLADQELTVTAVLEIPPSPEADELHVSVGQWGSPPVRSKPPHLWM